MKADRRSFLLALLAAPVAAVRVATAPKLAFHPLALRMAMEPLLTPSYFAALPLVELRSWREIPFRFTPDEVAMFERHGDTITVRTPERFS